MDNNPEEIWRKISELEGFERFDKYYVSNLGRVKSLYFNKETILKYDIDKDGYYKVALSKGGKRVVFMAHRIVALAFVINNDKLNNKIVHHLDANKQNLRFDNLEWTTSKQNSLYFHASEAGAAHRKKMSEKMKGTFVGEKNPFYGKKHPPELLKQIADKNRGRKHSDEALQKMSDAKSGEKNPFYGKTHTPKSREKISNGLKEYYKKIA